MKSISMFSRYTVPACLAALAVVGCEQKPAVQSDQATSAQQPASSIEVYEPNLPDGAPVIRVGTEANYAPYEFKDEYGNVVGFDVDLIKAVGETQGFAVEIYNDPWSDLFNNLESGSRDMLAAGLTPSEERRQRFMLSTPYNVSNPALMYFEGEQNIQSVAEMKVLNIGVLENSQQSRYFDQHPDLVASRQAYPTTFLAVQALAQDKVDAVASDEGVLRYTMRDLPELQAQYFRYEGEEGIINNIYLVNKGNHELLQQLNSGIEAVKKNGTYGKLTEKWFGKDMTTELNDGLQKLNIDNVAAQ